MIHVIIMFLEFQLANVTVLSMVSSISWSLPFYTNKLAIFYPIIFLLLLISTSLPPPLQHPTSIAMPRKLPQVMWPRKIASKILRKRLGSNNFVADFPSGLLLLDDYSLELPCLDLESSNYSNSIFSGHRESHNYKVFVSTWNVGGVSPPNDFNMDDLLDTPNNTHCDIYVIGFQEVVPLRAANILGYEKSKICTKWNSLIRKSLNKKRCSSQQEYRCLISKRMVGILVSVWVRSNLHQFVRNPCVSCVGCGIMGLGNKGSVSVRFRLHETSFCFVCSHLASGNRVGDEKIRNSNVAHIFSATTFPKVSTLDLPINILDHDRVILLGDLNYRISLPEHKIRVLVDKGEWNMLIDNDQLKQEIKEGEAFEGWQEGVINFAPTYKYYVNSDAYYGSDPAKKGQKKRAPAWCDRIMWYGDGLKQDIYTRNEMKLSDHRPVKAVFSSQVKVLQSVKGFRNFFLSERFDVNTNRLESSSFLI